MTEHTKYRYEECYAKSILEFFNIIKNLKIEDKPDLYDSANDIGIEVTEAVEQDKKEAIKLWYTMEKHPLEIQKKNKERMKQLGYEYQKGVMVWNPIIYDNGINSKIYDIIYNSLTKKLELLNKGNYKICKENDLFILTELMIKQDWEYAFMLKIINTIKLYEKKFDKVFILLQNTLVEVIIEKEFINTYEIDEWQSMIANNAWYYAQGGE